ncbi:MAG: ion transporter [Lachnospiraceae bacterium]|nr:ion transporter [Lachnospiraceae bacterium]
MKSGMEKKSIRRKVFQIISIGNKSDLPSRIFDIALVVVIVCNLTVTLLSTFDYWDRYDNILNSIELVTIVLFLIEYVLRIWTADYLYPDKKRAVAVSAFIFSLSGLIDLLTFLPYFMPFLFPAGAVAFRMLRVIRIFRLFRINAQNDAFSVIVDVLYEKRNQLLFSIVLILIFMVAASLCMYDLEHEAQPEAFENAFSGIWWSVSTLLTVGYGDIYPITIAGRIMAIIISFLGVGMVAIPTGIISAGFVQQYTKRKSMLNYGREHELEFVTLTVPSGHPWEGMRIDRITLPPSLFVSNVVRGRENMPVRDDLILCAADTLMLATLHRREESGENLREISVNYNNEWIGKAVRELDLQSDEHVVLIRRNEKMRVPDASMTVCEGDAVLLYNR